MLLGSSYCHTMHDTLVFTRVRCTVSVDIEWRHWAWYAVDTYGRKVLPLAWHRFRTVTATTAFRAGWLVRRFRGVYQGIYGHTPRADLHMKNMILYRYSPPDGIVGGRYDFWKGRCEIIRDPNGLNKHKNKEKIRQLSRAAAVYNLDGVIAPSVDCFRSPDYLCTTISRCVYYHH
jgi:hypothetical protein